MRQVTLSEVTHGMILARSLLASNGQILLNAGVSLTDKYISKLGALKVHNLFIKDELYEDIVCPEYVGVETQQRALVVLTNTVERLNKDGTFSTDAVYNIAGDIVEELLSIPDVSIHLTGIAVYDDFTMAHSLNCAIYAILLARFVGFAVPKIKEIACGALLHDVGKTEIDRAIINKPGKLSAEEFQIIQRHPDTGFKLLIKRRWELSSLISHMAWQHHEKVDGSGYPRGLKNDEILSYARILAIADVYEAISVNRPYRNAMTPQETYKIMQSGLGSAFDENYCRIFLSKIATYLPGMKVLLNTGETAIIVAIPADYPRRPFVRIITFSDGSPCKPPRDISLVDNPHIVISSGH